MDQSKRLEFNSLERYFTIFRKHRNDDIHHDIPDQTSKPKCNVKYDPIQLPVVASLPLSEQMRPDNGVFYREERSLTVS